MKNIGDLKADQTLFLRRIRPYLWGGCFFAILIVSVAIILKWNELLEGSTQTAPVAVYSPRSLGIEAKFSLVDQDGRQVSQDTYRGRHLLVFFGFTYCPQVCPLTLSRMTEVLELLGPDAEKVVPLFFTVDPERDSPSVIKEYLKAFDPRIQGLTGTVEQALAVQKAFRIYAAKVITSDGTDYTMDHTALIYLMDAEGMYKAHVPHELEANKIVERLRPYLS